MVQSQLEFCLVIHRLKHDIAGHSQHEYHDSVTNQGARCKGRRKKHVLKEKADVLKEQMSIWITYSSKGSIQILMRKYIRNTCILYLTLNNIFILKNIAFCNNSKDVNTLNSYIVDLRTNILFNLSEAIGINFKLLQPFFWHICTYESKSGNTVSYIKSQHSFLILSVTHNTEDLSLIWLKRITCTRYSILSFINESIIWCLISITT